MNNKIVAMIPALSGGQRVPNKNLILVDGEPMINYVLRAANSANLIDEIYVNSNIEEFKKICSQNNAIFYSRKKDKGGESCLMSNVSANCDGLRCQVHDHYICDFLNNIDCEYLIQIHTTSPLIKPETINQFIDFMISNDYDSCFSVVENYKELLIENKPLNFSFNKKTPTQDLKPVQEVSWALSGWKKQSFLDAHNTDKSPTYNGKVGFYPISKLESIDVDTVEDLYIAEACLSHQKRKKSVGKYFYHDNIISIERDLDTLIEEDGSPIADYASSNILKNSVTLAKSKMGPGSWCYPVVITENDQVCLIQQVKGEGCRNHYHVTKAEWWVVMEGVFEWIIDGKEKVLAKAGDIMFLDAGVPHVITCVSETPGIRLACGAKNMEHVYV